MASDWELLERYAKGKEQEAFALLVRRHVDMVYGAARRILRRAGPEAEDVVQAVFLLLAQKADRIPRRGALAGWLFRATGYCCRDAKKMNGRRRRHEREAAVERHGRGDAIGHGVAIPGLGGQGRAEFAELLDEALGRLGEKERQAIVVRYLEGRSVLETTEALGVSISITEKRLKRGLEKLRGVFARKGFVVPAAGVEGVMMAEGAKAAPAGLAGSVAGGAGSAGAAAVSMAKGAAVMMKVATIKTAAAIICILVALGLGTGGVVKWAGSRNEKPIATAAADGAAARAPATAAASGATALEVESVVEGNSDRLLKEVLAGMEESRKKLKTLYVVGESTSEVFDFTTDEWKTGTVKGRMWMEAGAERLARVEVDSEQQGDQEASYVEAWDGTVTRRLYGKPLSEERGIIERSRQLKGERLGGADYSFQLAWDEETSADASGVHKTIDRDPLSPGVLAGMKLEARRVKLRGVPATEPIDELTVRFGDKSVERTETFWFDMTGGGARKGYALIGRVDSIAVQGKEMRRVERRITHVAEAAPGVFYPTEGTMVWMQRGRAMMREHYVAKSVVANDAALAGDYHLVFPADVGVVEVVNGREIPAAQK